MYTAKIVNKETVPQGLKITVDFSDGTNTITEWSIPQDEDGFKYWVKSRLESLNSIITLNTGYAVNSTVDVSDPVPPALTQAQIDEKTWFTDYARWIRIKTTLVDTGVVDINNAKVQALLSKVKTNLKPEYVDKI